MAAIQRVAFVLLLGVEPVEELIVILFVSRQTVKQNAFQSQALYPLIEIEAFGDHQIGDAVIVIVCESSPPFRRVRARRVLRQKADL